MAPGLNIAIAEKRFAGSEPLFTDFKLTLEPGSVTALLGPSGVGKSTLLRLIAGVDAAYTGSITVDGIPAHAAPPPGLVFQDARLLPWLTALDNIRLATPDMPREAAQSALANVGLADHAKAWPHALSGGMQRRVALARALATNADLLLLDEPFVSLDQSLAADMRQLLATHIARTRPTVILTTHRPQDAAGLATQVVTLHGRPVQMVSGAG